MCSLLGIFEQNLHLKVKILMFFGGFSWFSFRITIHLLKGETDFDFEVISHICMSVFGLSTVTLSSKTVCVCVCVCQEPTTAEKASVFR